MMICLAMKPVHFIKSVCICVFKIHICATPAVVITKEAPCFIGKAGGSGCRLDSKIYLCASAIGLSPITSPIGQRDFLPGVRGNNHSSNRMLA